MSRGKVSRRAFLAQTASMLAAGTLAACGRSTPAPAPEAPAQPAATEAATAAPVPEATAVPAATAIPAAAPATVAPAAVEAPSKYKEAPALAELVKQGQLPPVEERLPEEPWVVEPLDGLGQYGGKLSSIVSDPTADLFEVEGSMSRAVAGRTYDQAEIIPLIAKGWELSDDHKELTIHLRKGLKWSDGSPLTTADVQFWYEDVFLNQDLTPTIDQKWMPAGKVMGVVVDDEFTFRLQFEQPYPVILEFLSALTPWMPKAYLSQWHIKYNPQAGDLAKSEKYDSWATAFQTHANLAQALQLQQDAKLPALTPWVYDHQDTQGNRMYVRNPYYYAVDSDGSQLPYADSIERVVVENREVLNAKVLAGEGTHHSWFLSLADYPLYKQNEQKGNFTANLYQDLRASEMGFCFNYTHKDETLRTLFNDVKWRQAVSYAINRPEINELRFAGLGVPRQPIMHPGTSFWKEGIDQTYVEYDVDKANQLLDEIGLQWDTNKEWRLRPDGQPLVFTMEVDAGRADLLEICNLIKGYWTKIGVNMNVKGEDQQFFMQRMAANEHDLGVWAIGGSSEIYSHTNEPIRYRPPWHWTNTPLGGPLWRQWLDTNGEQGLEPPDVIKHLWEVSEAWRQEPAGTDKYKELGAEMLQINADNIWCIGTVGLVPRVGIVKNTVRNAPKKDMILSIEYDMWRNYLPEQWWLEG